MKASELMIGDWINPLNRAIQRPCRVINLGNDVALVAKGTKEWIAETSELEGIPITAEILEKNGFEDVGDGIVQFFERPYYVWFVPAQYELGIEEGITTTEEIGTKIVLNMPCLYVHELQHALKLCGIEKEIVL